MPKEMAELMFIPINNYKRNNKVWFCSSKKNSTGGLIFNVGQKRRFCTQQKSSSNLSITLIWITRIFQRMTFLWLIHKSNILLLARYTLLHKLRKKCHLSSLMKIALAIIAVSLHWPILPGWWRSVDFHRNLNCRETDCIARLSANIVRLFWRPAGVAVYTDATKMFNLFWLW